MVKKLILPSLIAFTMLQADTNIEFVTEVSITNLYVSILDRSPRADGLNYWMNSGLSNKHIASSFLEQPETQDRYPNGLSDADLIQNVYQNIFNRAVDTEGFDYWYKEITTSKITRSQFILNVMAGSKGDDEKLLDNKTGVALAYAKSGNTDLVKAKKVLENVTANDGSVINTIQTYSLSQSYTQITTSYKLKVINDAKLKITDPAKAAELKAAEEAALKAKIAADEAAAAKVIADKKAAEEAAKVAVAKAAADKKAAEEAATAAAANAVVVAAPSAPAVPKDTVIPTIALIGNATVAHEAGTVYTDAGATADDVKDGNITANIVVTGAVTQMGSNILSYNVQDAAGNLAQEVNRTVNVSDTTNPTIQILGGGGVDKNITVDFEAQDVNSTLIDAQIADNLDTNLTTLINVLFNGQSVGNSLTDINTTQTGVYTLNYKVTDDYNNSAEANKTVIVDQNDTTAPFIQLTDRYKTITLNVGDAPYDENITKDRVAATDAHDGDLTSELNITRDSNLTYNDDNSTASYKIYYNVTDKNGNKAIPVIRVIKQIKDIEAPSIAINGDANITIRVGDVYNDRSVLVGDNIDSVANIDINATWFEVSNNALANIPLDDANITTTEGNYTIRYSATDKAENTSIFVDRNVTILEEFKVAEVSELNTTVNLTLGDPYRYATYLGADKSATITKKATSNIVPTDANDITTQAGDFNITYALDSDTAITINQKVIVAKK